MVPDREIGGGKPGGQLGVPAQVATESGDDDGDATAVTSAHGFTAIRAKS